MFLRRKCACSPPAVTLERQNFGTVVGGRLSLYGQSFLHSPGKLPGLFWAFQVSAVISPEMRFHR
jgi:hypothetical protein